MRRAHRHILVLTAQLTLAAWAGRVARVTVARIVPRIRQGVASSCFPVAATIVVACGDGRESLGPPLVAEAEVLRHVVPLKCVLRGHRLVIDLKSSAAAGSVYVERRHRRVVVRAVGGALGLGGGDRLQGFVLVTCVA